MPNLDEFLNKNHDQPDIDDPALEKIDGTRTWSKCDLYVRGAFWDSQKMLLTWKCSSGHENSIQVG